MKTPFLPLVPFPQSIKPRFRAAFLLVLYFLVAAPLPAPAQTYWATNVPHLIDPGTNHPSQVYVSISGATNSLNPGGLNYFANNAANNIFVNNDKGTGWTSYPLTQFEVSGASISPGLPASVFAFTLTDISSGRIFISIGSPITSEAMATNGNVPYAVIEETYSAPQSSSPIAGAITANLDLSYVNSAGLPATVSFYGTNSANPTTPVVLPNLVNTWNPLPTSNNLVAGVKSIFDANTSFAGIGTSPYVSNSGTLVTVLSPASLPTAYHTWDSLMDTLKTSVNVLQIASTNMPSIAAVPAWTRLQGVPFGYTGSGTNYSSITGWLPSYQTGQSYSATAAFTKDLNPAGNASLTALGIPSGTPGVVIAGSGSLSGAFSLFVTQSSLNSAVGIYGANPPYVVSNSIPAYYATPGILNDLSGRVVGDLMAGMTFGWANSTNNVYNVFVTNAPGTTINAGVVLTNMGILESANTTVRQLTSGQLFALLSLAAAQTPSTLAKVIGPNLDTNPFNYDPYAYAVSSYSVGYSSAFGDRIQGLGNPNPTWYTTNPAAWDGPTNYIVPSYLKIELGGGGGPAPTPTPTPGPAETMVTPVKITPEKRTLSVRAGQADKVAKFRLMAENNSTNDLVVRVNFASSNPGFVDDPLPVEMVAAKKANPKAKPKLSHASFDVIVPSGSVSGETSLSAWIGSLTNRSEPCVLTIKQLGTPGPAPAPAPIGSVVPSSITPAKKTVTVKSGTVGKIVAMRVAASNNTTNNQTVQVHFTSGNPGMMPNPLPVEMVAMKKANEDAKPKLSRASFSIFVPGTGPAGEASVTAWIGATTNTSPPTAITIKQ